MASDAVAMLSSSCEPSQCYDNEMKRSFRGSRDQLLTSTDGLGSSRERLFGSKDDLTSSREGLKAARVAIPEEESSTDKEGASNIAEATVLEEDDSKESEDEKEEVDDEAKDEDSKKHDADGKQSEDELDSEYNVDKMEEDYDDKDQADAKTEDDDIDQDDKLQSPISTPSPEVPKKLIRPNSLVETPKHLAHASNPTSDASKVNSSKLVTQIVEFICDNNTMINLDLLRKCMFLQMERFKIRLKGVKDMTELLKQSSLIPSVKYCLLNGWQGIVPNPCQPRTSVTKSCVPPCLDMLDMLPSYDKAQLTLAYSAIIDWSMSELRRLVTSAEHQMRGKIPRGARMKESLNHRDQNGVGTLTSSRYIQ